MSHAISSQSQIEQTILEFEKFKQLNHDIREAQLTITESRKVLSQRDAIMALKMEKLKELSDAQNSYSKNSGYLISLQDSLK